MTIVVLVVLGKNLTRTEYSVGVLVSGNQRIIDHVQEKTI